MCDILINGVMQYEALVKLIEFTLNVCIWHTLVFKASEFHFVSFKISINKNLNIIF